MKEMRKTRLSIALGAALGVAAMVPVATHAFSVNLGYNEIVTEDSGDALIFPFYTTANGSTTSFNVTNTSGQTVAAKIRFREQKYSLDVLDFIVILSPFDKFDFWVQSGPNGRPIAKWHDNSCVVGNFDQDTTASIPTFEMPFPANPQKGARPGVPDADMAVGHVEVIGMLDLNDTQWNGADLADAAAHNQSGVPTNCMTLDNAFKSREAVNKISKKGEEGNTLATALGVPPNYLLIKADVDNVLIGAYIVTADGQGVEAGEDAMALRNTFNRGFLAAQSPEAVQGPNCPDGWVGTPPAIRAEQVISVENVDLTTSTTPLINQGNSCLASLYAWDGQEDDHPHLGDVNWVGAGIYSGFGGPIAAGTVVAVLDNLTSAPNSLQGDWSNNPENHVGFDWVVSFTDKYVYTDTRITDLCALSEVNSADGEWMWFNYGNKYSGFLPNVGGGAMPWGCGQTTPFGKTAPKDGIDNVCLTSDTSELVLEVWDTEEGSTETISPIGQDPVRLCNETTVLTIEDPDGPAIKPSLIQTEANRVVLDILDTGGFDGVRGWADLPLNWVSWDLVKSNANLPFLLWHDGASTSGLLWMVRATMDPTINNGSLRELKRDGGVE